MNLTRDQQQMNKTEEDYSNEICKMLEKHLQLINFVTNHVIALAE